MQPLSPSTRPLPPPTSFSPPPSSFFLLASLISTSGIKYSVILPDGAGTEEGGSESSGVDNRSSCLWTTVLFEDNMVSTLLLTSTPLLSVLLFLSSETVLLPTSFAPPTSTNSSSPHPSSTYTVFLLILRTLSLLLSLSFCSLLFRSVATSHPSLLILFSQGREMVWRVRPHWLDSLASCFRNGSVRK
eukprot:752174-Hanusia_phi.AAC.1